MGENGESLESLLICPFELLKAIIATQSRFRIDGVPIDHMQSASDTGVMSWVTSGRLDLVADIRFPREDTDLDLSTLVADLVDDITDRLRESSGNRDGERIPGRGSLTRDALKVPETVDDEGKQKEREERKKALRFAKAVKASASGEEEEEEVLKRLEEEGGEDEEEDKIVSIDLDLRFKDLKAHVPVCVFILSVRLCLRN